VLLLKARKRVKVRGLPHLAKNERDMGHPTIPGRDTTGPKRNEGTRCFSLLFRIP
jgi:hypothetical protein